MNEDEQQASAPSPSTRAFIDRRTAMDAASAAADAVEAERQHRRQAELRSSTGEQNPIALIGGLAVLALLLLGFVFMLDRLRGDPWFADCPTGQTSCR